MKLRITLKDPDGVYNSINESVRESLGRSLLSDDEFEALFEARRRRATVLLSKWIRFGEYLNVEIDTDAGTATVMENK